VQNATLSHRGRKPDPVYRARGLLTNAHERLDEHGEQKLLGLLVGGDPHGDVRMTWHGKETIRSIYDEVSQARRMSRSVWDFGDGPTCVQAT